ncbi:MAG: succinate dehydrogenase cytochrome b subunit [Deltaproteobacteria bacterium]|nr:succinate dehydrogenase cytochrome b subunit [Deltaproteobacteria bacterium]
MSDGERVVRGALPVGRLVGDFLGSSVGAKVIMALTGVVLWSFLIGHLVGNLQIFQAPDAINGYAVFLHTVGHGAALWLVRAALLGCLLAHIAMGMRLTALNRAARPIAYAKKKRLRTTPAALWMAASGVLLFMFLAFHLAHFTIGLVDPSSFGLKDAEGQMDVYKMVWIAFKNPVVVVTYVVAQFFVLSHLMHGTASLWQSIGVNHGVWTPVLSGVGKAIALFIFVGNLAIPVVILIAWGKP